MIRREAQKRKIRAVDVSKTLGISYSSARTLFLRSTMQVQRLGELSDLFQYNFFRELAQQFSYADPVCSDNSELERATEEIEKLQKRIFELEVENRTLKAAFRDAMAR